MKDIFTTANMLFVLEGLKMTLYISFVSIPKASFGTILGVPRFDRRDF